MLGVNLLVRLGRCLVAGPLEESGFLPSGYYRHRALEALTEEDFPEALRFLKLAGPGEKGEARMLAQIVILRLRLLMKRHRSRRQAWMGHGGSLPGPKLEELLKQEDLALTLLTQYEGAALKLLGKAPLS